MKTQLHDIGTEEFLRHLKDRFTVIHNSNLFLRDLQYGMMSFLESKGRSVRHDAAERMALDLAARLVGEGVFRTVDRQSWCLNFPAFALPRQEKPAPKPTAPAAPAAPAAGAKPASAPAPAAPAAPAKSGGAEAPAA